ncbi:MAG: FkbM family methyltransferase [Acidovorax sp.]|jgi:FkbM family methyltransferase|uniref:FkbM family methyltransferase n=1 Tax=Acidovorax sp. TaxID=1872122 RepID=UPI0026017ABE|nr:FkbM family methyltransferase [Acidovorax sp.]MDH4462611.1 FkbM family methyltransferase [Acidovorax sp.]
MTATPALTSNDPRDLDGKRLQNAMQTLGRDPALRARLIALLRESEDRIAFDGPVRDEVVGPIIDALHLESDEYEKVLADGTRFQFLYRTKIARDFLLSESEHPSHVWEPQTTKLLLELSRDLQGDVLVGGAYFGDQAVLVARAIAGRGLKVHCFEPNPQQAQMLQRNIDLNHLTNVAVNVAGLWSRSGERMRLDGFDSFANMVTAQDGSGFDTVAMDDYARQQGRRIGLIQLDIEGAELSALQGARELLARDKPSVVFELHRTYVDWTHGLRNTPLCSLLLDLGYTVHAVRDINSHREMPGQPIELVPLDAVYLEGPPHGFNMLAVPDAARVQGSAFRMVEGVSPKLLPHKTPHLHHPVGGF